MYFVAMFLLPISTKMTPAEIREARQSLGLTQQKFGELLHAKIRTVQDWEAGKRKMQASTAELLKIKIKGEVK